MIISVIGGSGFIGTRLVQRLLAAGHEVRILDIADSAYYPDLRLQADVRDIESLISGLKDSDAVINLAAEHRDDVSPVSLYDEVNVRGAENICIACDISGITKIIFSSSVSVYGFAPKGTDETGRIGYFGDYGRTKWLAEQKFRQWLSGDNRKSLTIIRPAVVFGERNRGNVYNLIRQIAHGRFLMVGNGKNIKSMAYVENVASFIEFCLTSGSGENLYNYTDKPDMDMNTFVDLVRRTLGKEGRLFHWPYWLGYLGGRCFDLAAALLGRKFPVSSIRVKKFCADSMFDSAAIRKTAFHPPVDIHKALEDTITFEFSDETGHCFPK